MKFEHLPPLDTEIVRSFARAVEFSAIKYKKDVPDFCKQAVKTEIFKNFKEDYSVFGQSGSAIAGKILDELNIKKIFVKQATLQNKSNLKIDSENGYWMGYLIAYWYFLDSNEYERIKNIDFSKLFDLYDTLHTQDILYAIKSVRELV